MYRDSSVGITTCYGLDGPEIESRWFFEAVPTGLGFLPTSCTIRTGSFPGVNQPVGDVDHLPLSSADVKERVQLYLYTPFRPWRIVIG